MNGMIRSSLPSLLTRTQRLVGNNNINFMEKMRGIKTFHASCQAKGQVAQKSPSKVMVEAGKTYKWCACGLSGKQPFCDGSHKNSPDGITPMAWKAPEAKEIFFCNCKQTGNQPLCDGTHKKL